MKQFGDLSRNFWQREFNCKHCNMVGKINPDLIFSLQQLRDNVKVPIIVTSGFRCKMHPAERTKKITGQHVLGNAADIIITGYDVIDMYKEAMKILKFKHGGIGIYVENNKDSNFIHVDVRGTPARWGRINGEYTTLDSTLEIL